MRPGVFRVDTATGNAQNGKVRWDARKSLWINGCLVLFAALAPFHTTAGAVAAGLLLTYLTLLLGHSVGMHRKLIHRSYDCPRWLERILVYLGVLVGMGGPSAVIRIHDVRDWAQREADCHDYFSHRAAFLKDAWWQLNCRFEFDAPPVLQIEPDVSADPFYRILDRTWMLQQLPLGVLLYAIGGLPWVVWGVFGRVFLSVAGHWTITYLTHNPGPGRWLIPDAGVQASNLPGFGLLTLGECWHNNHHAFPESARIGLAPGELEAVGWVSNVGLPRCREQRADLVDTFEAAPARCR